MTDTTLKQKFAHEITELLTVFIFLAPFSLALNSYRMNVEGDFSTPYLDYGMALVKALVLSKVILLGEFIHLGERSRNKALLIATIEKAAVFTLFYLMFELVEDGVRGSLHGTGFWETVHKEAFPTVGGLVSRMLFVFFALMPFFALMETRRVLGAKRFRELFLGTAHGRRDSSQTRETSEPMTGSSPRSG